ncbi:MAG: ABC transporter ATP-binding protein [Candidatus Kariarchaeaceae archaeon]|jgi:putative ABC transport system ATP-binding protein
MALVTLKEVSKTYLSYETAVQAIAPMDFEINEGEFIVIFGKSGSGKSTLLTLISGLERPSTGEILINDEKINDYSQDKLALMRRNNIGIVFQHFYLLDAMSAFENIEVPLILSGMSLQKREERAMQLLQLVGLEERAAHNPNELSGGERQRVAIARALANEAKLIIADEPTGDLDSTTGSEIIELLIKLNKGKLEGSPSGWKPTVVMVTHDTSILQPGMRVVTLSDGQITSDDVYQSNVE